MEYFLGRWCHDSSISPGFVFSLLLTVSAAGGENASGASAATEGDERLRPPAGRTASSNPVGLIVKLDFAPLSSYQGNIPGLPATSPRTRGQKRLNLRSPGSQRYLAYLTSQRQDFEAQLKRKIPQARISATYDHVFGGVAVLVPEDPVPEVVRLPHVEAVYPDELQQLNTERSPQFIGAPHLWQQLGGQDKAGEGVIVGILDTGIWPERPSFADPDPLGKPYPVPPPPLLGARECRFTGGANPGAPFPCNNKLIAAYRFMTTHDTFSPPLPTEFTTARDDHGHGTHTASTAAGNGGVAASLFGVPRGIPSGVAPRAHVIAYKVCGHLSCFESDSVAAINRAIQDGVDVINFSISGSEDPYTDPVALAFLDAYEAGVFVAASAGNSGPDPDTVQHRGPWVTTVGASTSDRHFLSTITLTGADGNSLRLVGASITEGISTPIRVVLPPVGQELCGSMPGVNPFLPGTFRGEIVICRRGEIGRVEKGLNVLQGGPKGCSSITPLGFGDW